MLHHVFIDTSTYSSPADQRLISYIRFLADDLMAFPVVSSDTFFENDEDDTDDDEGTPGIWYDDGSPDDKGLLPYLVPFTSFGAYAFISKDPAYNRIFMAHRGLDAETAILFLAAMGVETCVPRTLTRNLSQDEIRALQEKLGEERNRYMRAVAAMADESFERITSCYGADLLRWARNEAIFKIQPEAERLEVAFQRQASNTMKDILRELVKEGPIVIGRSLVEPTKTAEHIIDKILPIFSSRLAKERFAAASPLGEYLLRLKGALPPSEA